jgi:hypothetical protein
MAGGDDARVAHDERTRRPEFPRQIAKPPNRVRAHDEPRGGAKLEVRERLPQRSGGVINHEKL